MKYNPKLFAEWLETQRKAKAGYLMGAVGQKCAELTAGSWLVSQYRGNAAQYAKAKYWLAHAERVFDCQGLADCYVSEVSGVKTNVYARNNYSAWCNTKGVGKIPAQYRVPGAAVFYHNGSRITHVGFLVAPVDAGNPGGDWYVVEARGVLYGVVRTKLLSRTWNRWGLMDAIGFDYSEVLGISAPETKVLGARVLRKGCVGEDVQLLQEALMKLGYDLPKYGADGDFGAETKNAVSDYQKSEGLDADGVYDEDTHAALMDALDDADEGDDQPAKTVAITAAGTWNVRKGPGTGYAVLTYVKSGAKLPYISRADNGWVQAEINGGAGWISGKCATVE